MKRFRFPILLIVSFLMLAACAPQASRTPLETPEAEQTERVARIAHHRMEIGLLETGSYTTNVLIDLDLPRGVRWTVLEFANDDYLLRITHDAVPSTMWLVDPAGVTVRAAPAD